MMKGLKTLSDGGGGSALLASLAPASAERRRLQPLRRLRRLAERETGARLPEEPRQGRLLPQQQRDVFYTVCVKFPTKHASARRKQEAAGHALRQQDHLEHPRQTQGQLVRRRQEGRVLRLQRRQRRSRHAGAARLRHGDRGHRRLRAARRRGPLRVAARPLGRRQPGAHDARCSRRSSGRSRPPGGWERGRARSRSASGPARSPACGSGSPRARALGASTGLPLAAASAPSTRSAAASPRRRRRRIRLAVLDARRGEVFAAAYAAAGERLWGPWVGSPAGARRAARRARRTPPLAAGSGAVRFREELAGPDVEMPEDADPAHRVAARHVCALAAAGAGARPSPPPRSI